VVSLFVPETYGPSVLRHKAKYLRNRENTTKYKSQMEIEHKSIISTIRLFCTRPFRIVPYLTDLTTRPPAPRTDMFFIMSLPEAPMCLDLTERGGVQNPDIWDRERDNQTQWTKAIHWGPSSSASSVVTTNQTNSP
jgi:hypothetical protein